MVPNVKRERLAAEIDRAIDAAEASVMRWGSDDCVLWCANILRDAIALDPVPTIRGRYADQEGAHAIIGKQGLAAGMRYRARKFGWQHIDPERAQVGDLGVVKDPSGFQSCLLKFRGRFWIGRGWHGVVLVPGDKVSTAWSVA